MAFLPHIELPKQFAENTGSDPEYHMGSFATKHVHGIAPLVTKHGGVLHAGKKGSTPFHVPKSKYKDFHADMVKAGHGNNYSIPDVHDSQHSEDEQFAEGDFHSVLKKHGYKADDNKRTVYTHPDLGWGVHLGTNYGWKHKEHDDDGGGHLGRGVSAASLDRHLAAMHDTQHTEAPVAIHGQGVMTPPIQYLETTTSKPNKRMKKDISAEEVSSKVPGNEQQKPEQFVESDHSSVLDKHGFKEVGKNTAGFKYYRHPKSKHEVEVHENGTWSRQHPSDADFVDKGHNAKDLDKHLSELNSQHSEQPSLNNYISPFGAIVR